YVPVAPKTWLMTELPSVEFPPSPKFHSYRTIRPSGSFEADASKTRGVPTLPKGRAVVNVAFGGMSTYREADELFLPLKLSVTVKVTVYRPPRVSKVPFGRYDVAVTVPGATLEVRRIFDDRRIRIHVEAGVRRLVDHLQEHRGARFESIIVSGGDRHIVCSKGVVIMVRAGVGRIPRVPVAEVPVPVHDRSIGVVAGGVKVRVLTHVGGVGADA